MRESVNQAKDALPELWKRLSLRIAPENKLALSKDDKIQISGEFKDLTIRYTTDGNDPMWFSEEYREPFEVTKSKETVKAALFLGRRQMSKVFETNYISEEALNTAEGLEKDYSAVTDHGSSGGSDGVAKALDGKNYQSWSPKTFPTILELSFSKPVKVNAAELALDWFYKNYYDIADMDIEYWNGSEWVAAVKGAHLGAQSKVFTFDEFVSDKVRLKINRAWLYDYYGEIGVDAFRLFYLKDQVTADKGSLDQVISVAQKSVDQGEVKEAIKSVQESFHKVLAYAKSVSSNIESSQRTVDQTTIALIEEIQKLGFKAGDKTELRKHYSLYSALDRNNTSTARQKTHSVEPWRRPGRCWRMETRWKRMSARRIRVFSTRRRPWSRRGTRPLFEPW